ncbi:Clarin-1 Usher syndrome type-3 protein [Takifugu flavidus]|uniref:Clarin-1 Usher syndrome type-3 protein n=2 Tax=Takifugu flavidus TaxID=433684 RepID=A0A5C6PBU1_9TELE|nr:Clarin-1 Usher syndrome type-3 protein [Takifugu flavidus]
MTNTVKRLVALLPEEGLPDLVRESSWSGGDARSALPRVGRRRLGALWGGSALIRRFCLDPRQRRIMPSPQKRLVFSVSGLLSFLCALTAAVATGLPSWLSGTVLCRTGAELVNATGAELDKFLGELSYGLFHGVRVKQCGLGGRASRFSFFSELLTVMPAGLHVTVIFFCGVVILLSSAATGFFFFNAFGRPYEMLQGPVGLYLWTSISGLCSCLVLVLFAAEVKLHHLSDRIANFSEVTFTFEAYREQYDRCFWLFFLIFLIHGLNLALIRLTGVQFHFHKPKELDPSGGAADLMY